MSQYQVTSWRDLPSMVAARDASGSSKAMLEPRFQEAIDEAAMRMGATGADDYLDGWRRTEWLNSEEDPAALLDRLVGELQDAWPQERVASYLDAIGPAR